jgi:protein phosphatase
MTNLIEIAKEALRAGGKEYISLIENSTALLTSEEGYLEDLHVEGHLVRTEPVREIIVVGDLHGDFESLIHILRSSQFARKTEEKDGTLLVFLGDYGDRGVQSPEVYYLVLKLMELFPWKVVLMRGNHEGPEDLPVFPHDLPRNLEARFGQMGHSVYEALRELWTRLRTAVIVDEDYVLIHGGVPSQASSVEDLKYAHAKHPDKSHLEEILWSDPAEAIDGTLPSPRGAGKLFGENITRDFLGMLDARFLIRGHEPSATGFKTNHGGKVITLFSRKGAPYHNTSAAYLQLRPSNKLQKTKDFLECVKRF